MWEWNRSEGTMTSPDGVIVGKGYAGHDEGLNNPEDEEIKNVGPLPAGYYEISGAYTHPHLGPVAMYLVPVGPPDGWDGPATKLEWMLGRSAFFIHGRRSADDMGASNGCIVLDHGPRALIARDFNRRLRVV